MHDSWLQAHCGVQARYVNKVGFGISVTGGITLLQGAGAQAGNRLPV